MPPQSLRRHPSLIHMCGLLAFSSRRVRIEESLGVQSPQSTTQFRTGDETICLSGCAPPMLLPHLGGLFPVWNDSNRREPNEPVHSLTMPRLGVIAPGPGLTTLDAQRPSTRLRPAVHRQIPARTNTPVLPFAP